MKRTVVATVLLCTGLTAVVGLILSRPTNKSPQPTAVSAPNNTQSQVHEERPTPAILPGTAVSDVKDSNLLDVLYGPSKDKLDGKATLVLSKDFEQDGITKHILISKLSLEDKSHELLSAHVFARSSGKWVTENSYTKLENTVRHWPNSQISWLQIGPNNFAIQEFGTSDDDGARKTAFLSLFTVSPSSAPSGWRQIMNVTQSIEKGETVSIKLSFEKSQKPLWTAFIKTTFNGGKPLTVRYSPDNGEYVAAGTVPPMSVSEALKTRGLPNTDWDGSR
jgi:hypothetical protein